MALPIPPAPPVTTATDTDGDSIPDAEEVAAGTDPFLADDPDPDPEDVMEMRLTGRSREVRDVVVPLDGSEAAASALRPGFAIAERTGLPVVADSEALVA